MVGGARWACLVESMLARSVAWRQGVGREKEGEVAGLIERSNPMCSGSQNLFTKVLASEGWGQMRMIPLQAYPAQQWLFPIYKTVQARVLCQTGW